MIQIVRMSQNDPELLRMNQITQKVKVFTFFLPNFLTNVINHVTELLIGFSIYFKVISSL